MKWTKPTLITLAAIAAMFGVAVIVSEWRLSDVEDRLSLAEAQIAEAPSSPVANVEEQLDYSLKELRRWNCADAWSSLTDEQARLLYPLQSRRPALDDPQVPQAIQDLIEKYCE